MGTKIKLSPTIPFLLLTQIRLRSRPLDNIMATVEEAIKPLGLMSLKLLRKTKTRSRT